MPFTRKIAISLLFLSWLGVLGSTFMLIEMVSPYHWEWGIYGSCLILFLSSIVVVFFRQESSEQLLLKYKELKIQEDEEILHKLQKDFDSRLGLLEHKEKAVKLKLMQYKQYAEFPNEKITRLDSHDKGYFDDEVAQLLHDKAEIIFDKIINKKYIEKTVFKHQLLLEDMVDLIESVARIHHPESQNPLLETSIENLFRSLNRVSLQLLVLIDGFPINIKEYNLRKTYLYIQKSATTVGYYKKAEPFLTFASPLLRIGMASNPLIGVAQTVAIEAGKHVIKTGSERYALNLLHDVIEIIGEQASTIFGDTSLRYHSKDWIYAVELTELMHYFNPAEPVVLSKVMKIIGGLPISSEYDRIFIYHCLALNKSVNPDSFSNDFFTDEDKQELVKKLTDFIENRLNKNRTEENEKKLISWRKKTELRLAVKIPLNIDSNDTETLKNQLNAQSPEKIIKPFLARAILAMMAGGETVQFIYTDIQLEAIIPSVEVKQLWLIASNVRLCLLNVDAKENKTQCIWCYDSRKDRSLVFQKIKRVVADDCKVVGGSWQTKVKSNAAPAFIIEGRKSSGYDSTFQVLESFNKKLN
jgi:hypothetical protein